MAAPAASAWHRRRHVLLTPSNRVEAVLEPSSLRTNPNSNFARSSAPHVSRNMTASDSGPSTWSESNKLVPPQPTAAQFSIYGSLRQFSAPLRSEAQSSVFATVAVTALCALLAYGLMSVSNLIAATFSHSRSSFYRAQMHHFPVILLGFKVAACLLFALTLFAMHFLFSRIIVKQMRSWRRQLCARSALEGAFLRLRLLHAAGCISGCVLQTILIAYVTYGPLLGPPSITSAMGGPLQVSSRNRQLIPGWADLSPHTVTALFSGLMFSVVWGWSGAYANYSYPFRLSPVRRLALLLPRISLLSVVPVVLACFPGSLLHYLLSAGSAQVFSEAGWWAVLIHRFTNLICASCCSMVSLFSWNAMSVYEEQLLSAHRNVASSVRQQRNVHAQSDSMASERNTIMYIVQQCESQKASQEHLEELVEELLYSTYSLTELEEGLSEFPGFLDASGEVWRVTLHLYLTPIDVLHELLRSYNIRQFQSTTSSDMANGSVFLGPSRTGFPNMAASLLGTHKPFMFPDADLCITSCQVMSRLFEASYDLDTYGVVHRTLPQTIRSLLLCKEQTEAFIAFRDSKREAGTEEPFSREWNSHLLWFRRVMQFRSDYETIVAINDALMLAIYRIAGTFRCHMYDFVDGVEVAWDRSLDRQLRSFLDYQTS